MEVFYTFSLLEPEILSNSDFTSNTCLIIGKLFEYSFQNKIPSETYGHKKNIVPVRNENSKIWCDALRLYINIQTLLLNKLKYNFLSDSILFVGSYYEVMVQVSTFFYVILSTMYRHIDSL